MFIWRKWDKQIFKKVVYEIKKKKNLKEYKVFDDPTELF